MDGGIYDNQGIDCLLKYKPNAGTPYFDLIIVSDVASPEMTAYAPTPDDEKKGIERVTLRQYYKKDKAANTILNPALPALVAAAALLPLTWGYADTTGTGVCITLAIMLLIGWIIKRILLGKLVRLPAKLKAYAIKKNPNAEFYLQKLSALNLGSLSIHRARPLLGDRLSSLLTLLLSVFLKVVRRLNYNILYTDDRFRYRRISTLIHQLAEETDETPAAPSISPAIRQIATDAASFGTTLWFTPKNQLDGMLDKLVATGQFTLCYNMIGYLNNLLFDGDNGLADLPAATRDALTALLEQCTSDWARFQANPLFMVK
jgi:hypothetical protein